ncbi:MAG TPA: hypothetical protein VI911_10370 [Patescibacteria group bacterium]|nr:hypothetical protein [Patescibacteria group bacterium]
MVSDTPPDISLDLIRSKQSEIISKGNNLVKKIALRRRELSELETLKDLSERFYYAVLDESNKEKVGREKLSDKQLTRRVEYQVNLDDGRKTKGIYDKIRDVTNKIDTLMLIWRRNDDTADRIENMLNATINIEKRLDKHKEN